MFSRSSPSRGHCGHLVFFENTRCLHCSTPQAFVPDRLELVALEGEAAELHRCVNQTLATRNWMVPRVDELWRSCELTRTRPNDADPVGLAEFAGAEAAKRRVIFQLLLVSGDEECEDWPERFVSAYATMHPWEDWAETFAHYLHIRDTLQTAAEYGVTVKGPRAVTTDRSLKATPQPEAGERGFDEVKLRFVHGRVREHARAMVV
jgi:hypothetical protein